MGEVYATRAAILPLLRCSRSHGHVGESGATSGDTDSLVVKLAGAEAAEALAARDLRVATLRAPFTGTVVGLQIAEGRMRSLFTRIKDDTASPTFARWSFRALSWAIWCHVVESHVRPRLIAVPHIRNPFMSLHSLVRNRACCVVAESVPLYRIETYGPRRVMAASRSRDDPACPAALTAHEATLHSSPAPIRVISRPPLKSDSANWREREVPQ